MIPFISSELRSTQLRIEEHIDIRITLYNKMWELFIEVSRMV